MNYFEFYDIPVSFKPDKALVRKKYIEISRSSHPDFFAAKSAFEKETSLDTSTLNTNAYQVLSNDEQTISYVLSLKGVLETGEKYELPQDFLLDMMEVNEQLMDMEMGFDENAFSALKKTIKEKQNDSDQLLRSSINKFEAIKDDAGLFAVKDAWYRKKYLLRIQQRLNTFASPQ